MKIKIIFAILCFTQLYFAQPKGNNIKEVLQISSESEQYNLIRPTIIREDSKGNIFIYDASQHAILKFGARGKYINIIGRKGKGPGEFLYTPVFEIDSNDNLITFDAGNMRVSIFNNDGEIKLIHKTVQDIRKIICSKNGDYFIEQINDGSYNPDGISTSKVYKYSPDLKSRILIDSVRYKTDIQITEPVRTNLPIPFSGNYIWTIDKKGNVLSGMSDQQVMILRNNQGKIIGRKEFNIKKLKVYEKDKKVFLNSLGFYNGSSTENGVPKEISKQIKFPRYKDLIKTIGFIKNYLMIEEVSENPSTLKWLLMKKDNSKNYNLLLNVNSKKVFVSYSRNDFFITYYNAEGFPKITKYTFILKS